MSSRTIRNTIFIAGMVLVSSTFAGTDVIKCTDESGRVTLTDQPCKDAVDQVILAAAPNPEVELAQAPATPEAAEVHAPAVVEPVLRSDTGRHRLASLPPSPRLRAAPYTQVRAPGRALARDVATLKEAHRTLMLLDNTMTASRKQGLAAQR